MPRLLVHRQDDFQLDGDKLFFLQLRQLLATGPPLVKARLEGAIQCRVAGTSDEYDLGRLAIATEFESDEDVLAATIRDALKGGECWTSRVETKPLGSDRLALLPVLQGDLDGRGCL